VAHAFADISGLAAQAGRVHQTVNTMNDPKWAISRVTGNLEICKNPLLQFRRLPGPRHNLGIADNPAKAGRRAC